MERELKEEAVALETAEQSMAVGFYLVFYL
jgi:hypothetical protein